MPHLPDAAPGVFPYHGTMPQTWDEPEPYQRRTVPDRWRDVYDLLATLGVVPVSSRGDAILLDADTWLAVANWAAIGYQLAGPHCSCIPGQLPDPFCGRHGAGT